MWLHETSNYVRTYVHTICTRLLFTSLKIYMFHRHYTRVHVEISQGGGATATSLLDAPNLSELNFIPHNDSYCEHNTIRFGEMRNRIMQQ